MSRLRTKKRELLDWEAMYRRGTPPWETGLPAQELMRIVAEQALRPGAALELGCGTGANAIYLSQNRFDVTAVDASPLALERARLRCEEAGGLVHFVLGQTLGFVRALCLLGGHSQRRQSLGRLPGMLIDEGLAAVNKAVRLALPREEGKMRHGVARDPGENETQTQQENQREKHDEADFAKDALANSARNGSNWAYCHESIVSG